jgi:hypothetical protein
LRLRGSPLDWIMGRGEGGFSSGQGQGGWPGNVIVPGLQGMSKAGLG